jgi:hypothetical protein
MPIINYKVYKIHNTENCSYYYQNSNFAIAHGIKLTDYHLTTDNDLRLNNEYTREQILNHIYYVHDLVTSNIIRIENDFYYCNGYNNIVKVDVEFISKKYGIKITRGKNTFHYKINNQVVYFESEGDALIVMDDLKNKYNFSLDFSFSIFQKRLVI